MITRRFAPWLCSFAAFLLASATLAQSALPQAWVSKTSGLLYKVTVEGLRVRAEKVFPLDVVTRFDEEPFIRCEYTQHESEWEGKCASRLPLEDSRHRLKWCSFKFTSKITLLTAEKIEGESDVWGSEDVDVDHCTVRKMRRQQFVWIPKKIFDPAPPKSPAAARKP